MMSCSGGVSDMIPSQPNGYSFAYVWITPGGMTVRLTPW